MVGEMTFGLAVGGFFGFVLGIIIGAWLRKAPSVERLSETITDLHRRLDELQKTTATQKQVERVQNDLSNAQQTLAQVDRSLQNLVSFSQTSLQPQISQQLQNALDALSRVQQALQDAYQSLTAQHQSSEQRHQQLMDNLQMASKMLASSETLLREVSETLRSGQERLETELNQLRKDLAVAKENVQRINEQVGILTVLQQTAERVEENIKKVVETLTGRRSGQAGEQVVGKLLSAVPDDWLERNIRLGSGQVEFAIKMPGGYLIPLDSKFISPELIAQSESDGGEQMRRRVRDEVRRRAQEVAKYLTDHRVLGFGIAAVPDSVYDLCRDAVKAAAHDRIVVVPYSLLLPFVLSLYLMAQHLGISRLRKTDQAIGTAFTALEQARSALEKMTKEINSVSNLQQTALKQVIEAINSLRGLTHGEIALPDTATQPTLEVPQQAPEETSPSAPEA
jgi:DNA anti-recombination protein RmuC